MSDVVGQRFRAGERFCYLCDAVTPSQCHCVKTEYCPKCDKEFADKLAYDHHDCLKIVGMIDKALDEIDITNHHNALKCKYCNPKGLEFKEVGETVVAKRNEEEYRRIWNAAIETAYHIGIKASESPEGIKVAEEVRKLKK